MGKFIFLAIFLTVLILFGWTSNLVKTFHLDFQAPYKAEVIRIIGIPVPFVGIVAGYFTFDEEKEHSE